MDQRLRARVGFAILALVVPVQFVVQAVADEPYPGLFMPHFQAVPASHGQFSRTTLQITVTFTDGGRARIGPSQLLAGGEGTPEVAVLPLIFDTNLDPTDAQTVAWFRGRIADMFPHRRGQTVVIDVIRSTYLLADRSLISRHRVRSHLIEVG